MEWNYKIAELRIQDDQLIVGVACEGPYDAKVRSPKLVAVIDSKRDNRRFPVLIFPTGGSLKLHGLL